MLQESTLTLSDVVGIILDEYRLQIVGILSTRAGTIVDIAKSIHLKPSIVSRHLAKLQSLTLITQYNDGPTTYYKLNIEGVRALKKQYVGQEKAKDVSQIDNIEGEEWERKVLRDFFEGTRLKEIPASRKKVEAIVRWLATQFEFGVQYQEKEVNEIIQRHHPDYCFFRRDLVGLGLMQRERGIYWRV